MYRVLIVDDDVALTNYLMVFMVQSDLYEPAVVSDSREVAPLLEQSSFDVIILDMDMPHLNGLDLMNLFRERGIDTPVIVLSGFNDADMAVKALKLGAFDYLAKPVDDDYLLEVLDKAITSHSLKSSISQLPTELSREDLDHEEAFARLKTNDPEMIRLFHQVEKLAGGDLSIFIKGERGTGKSTLARIIHDSSPRKNGPFVAVNVADQDEDRFAALLFGQVGGWSGEQTERAGLVEQADQGTLFMSNIDCLAVPLQHRLDRLLQSGTFNREGTTRTRQVDVRLITGSTRDLASAIYRESFSRELLYHLRVNMVLLPPLRERVVDIPLLARHFMKQEVKRMGSPVTEFAPELGVLLQTYEFPGNQEELRDIIITSVWKEKGSTLGISSLSHYVRDKIQKGRFRSGAFRPSPLAEVIRDHVKTTVVRMEGDLDRAAWALEISRSELESLLAE
jgi:DNA-binding NtrC family response regulator